MLGRALAHWRTDMSTMRIMTAAVLAAVFAVSTASAQQPTTQRVAGTLDKVEGNTLTIKAASGPVLTVKFKDGAVEKKLVVGPNVPVQRLEVSDRNELKAGAAVASAAATKQPDGTFTAARIDVGRDGIVP